MFDCRLYCSVIGIPHAIAFSDCVELVQHRGELRQRSKPADEIEFLSWRERLDVVIADCHWLDDISPITIQLSRAIISLGSFRSSRLIGIVTPFETVTEAIRQHFGHRFLADTPWQNVEFDLHLSKFCKERWGDVEGDLLAIEFVGPRGFHLSCSKTPSSKDFRAPPPEAEVLSLSLELDGVSVTVERDFRFILDDVMEEVPGIARRLFRAQSIFKDYIELTENSILER